MPDFGCEIVSDDGSSFDLSALPQEEKNVLIEELTRDMLAAADSLEFERAADLRDRIRALKKG